MALLAVDHEQGCLVRDLREPLLDIHDGADEVDSDYVARPGVQDVVPELVALLVGPRVGALIDRDDELRRLLQEAHQLGFGCFHFARPFKSSSESPSSRFWSMNYGSTPRELYGHRPK